MVSDEVSCYGNTGHGDGCEFSCGNNREVTGNGDSEAKIYNEW